MIAGRITCDVCGESVELSLTGPGGACSTNTQHILPAGFRERSRRLLDDRGNAYFRAFQICQRCDDSIRKQQDECEAAALKMPAAPA